MFAVDYTDEGVRVWERDGETATSRLDPDYRPTIYVAADDWETLSAHRPDVDAHPQVADTARESWRRGFRHDHEPVLRVDVTDIDSVTPLARAISGFGRPGELRLFNVDFTRQFRYCLETDCEPDPDADLRTLELATPEPQFAREVPGLTEVTVDGEQTVTGSPVGVLETVLDRVHARDPDVLVLSSAEIVPALFAVAEAHDLGPVELGREPGYTQLAGESTFESYGRVGHSPARYTVPGRAIIDRSNTFFYHQTNLAGCLDLVGRSGKPIQELSWASIGNVLTAMQIHEAMA
ncbi:MAG: DNA polymerase I, partial [Halodesulfurarchaeum sp.]